MLLKKNRPFFFTDQQMAQLSSTNGTLRQLNRDARRELRGIGAGLTDKQYREAGLLLGKLAIRMISILRLREDVLNSGREQRPTRVELMIGVVCGNCVMPPHNRENTPNSQPPEVDPAHLPELDSLVEIAHNVGERVSLCFEPRTPPNAWVVGLKRLPDALLKQRRHLQDIAPNPSVMKIEVIEKFEACSVCHKPMENSPPSDDPSELISSENDLKN